MFAITLFKRFEAINRTTYAFVEVVPELPGEGVVEIPLNLQILAHLA